MEKGDNTNLSGETLDSDEVAKLKLRIRELEYELGSLKRELDWKNYKLETGNSRD